MGGQGTTGSGRFRRDEVLKKLHAECRTGDAVVQSGPLEAVLVGERREFAVQ